MGLTENNNPLLLNHAFKINPMKKLSFLLLLNIAIFIQTKASDTLYIQLNKKTFHTGDTLLINSYMDVSNNHVQNAILNVVIEQTNKKSRNAFRFPFIKGEAAANIIIGQDIPDGNYAMNFLIQKSFPQLEGSIQNYQNKTKELNYLMLLKNKPAYMGTVNISEYGNFKTPKFTFADTANFIFFEAGNKRSNLNIDIQYTTDSTYEPISSAHEFFKVGDHVEELNDTSFEFNLHEKIENKPNTLQTVTVSTKVKKKIELFDEAYSTGLFKGGFPTVFDGIESESIARSFDVFTFLQSRLAGISQKTNALGGATLYWRGQPLTVFIDEFKVDEDFVNMINVNDIAMIKVFPPFNGGPSNNGSIAIYTRRGSYELPNARKFKFLVRGFTPSETYWHL